MSRNWVIAPYSSEDQEIFNKVWQFDIAENVISIGWHELGDVSSLNRETLLNKIATTYPKYPASTRTLIANMLWAFFHVIAVGDIIIARRGRKVLAGVGTVTKTGYFAEGKNSFLVEVADSHSNFMGASWATTPRDTKFNSIVFPMHTLTEFSELQFQALSSDNSSIVAPAIIESEEPESDPVSFVLEKYLEDFIVSNFNSIFKGTLDMYADAGGLNGQQYTTEIGSIDILAVDQVSKHFVVIELKKGRPSDQVVGQVLRYMGWVKHNLCDANQDVRGLVICSHQDKKLSYALSMTANVSVKFYSVDFKLLDAPSLVA